MKKIVSLLVLTAVSTAFAQIQAIPATPADSGSQTPAASSQAPAATAGSSSAPVSTAGSKTTAPSKAVSTSVTTAKKEKPKSPWSGSLLSEVSRGANINHSKVLENNGVTYETNPDKRVESSLYFSGGIKYKASAKNSFSLNQRVAKDVVKNPAEPKDEEWAVLNTRATWTRATDLTLLGSGAIALPFGLEFPTNEDARVKSGMIIGFRFTPSIDWQLNPTFALNLTSVTQMNLKNPPDQAVKNDTMLESSSVLLSNTFSLSAALTDTIGVYQNLGLTSISANAKNPTAMDQQGAQMDVATGATWQALANLGFDLSVGQSAPVQGTGYKAITVYADREFKLYHEAQTSYTLDVTYTF